MAVGKKVMNVDALLERLRKRGIGPIEDVVVDWNSPENMVRHREVKEFIERLNRMHEETAYSTLYFGPGPEGRNSFKLGLNLV